VKSPAESERYRLAVEAGAEITQALAMEDAPAVIARRVAEALGVWECDLYEYDAVNGRLVATAAWAMELSDADVDWVGESFTLDERPSYRPIVLDGECLASSLADSGLDPIDRDLMEEWGELSTLTVPLHFRDRGVVGCLTLIEKREPRVFTAEDHELLTLLAGPAAVAVRNAQLFRLQQEQNRHLASLLETGSAMTSTVTLEDSLSHICRAAAGALSTTECIAYEYDPGRDAIVCRAFYARGGRPEGFEEGGVYPLDDYPSDREILRGGEVVQESISDERLPADVRASMEEWGEKACLNVPLVIEGEPLGILVLTETRRERTFGQGEVELARALAEQAATAIRHARLYRRGQTQNRRLAALVETSRVLVSSLDVAAVLEEVRREVADLFEVPGAAVAVLLRRGDAFVSFDPGDGAAGPGEDASAVELDELRSRAATSLAPAVSDAGAEQRLVVPFVLGDAAQGLLDVRAGEGRDVGDDELELLQVLASQAAAALANAALYRTLERLAITDGLTGLYNHRHFYERLSEEVARARRYALPLSLLMIDLDDFKHFNDRYGHPAGDLVLAEVGRILGTQIRVGIDFAARYGGEEFSIVLPNTAREGAHVVGTRLARELAAAPGGADVPPPHEDGAVEVGERIRVSIEGSSVPGVDPGTQITVSIGVACFPGAAGGPGELVRNADKALYLAKRLGKNRVEVFDG
jgi:diguanylate cyclase (GGDEF)-like protein